MSRGCSWLMLAQIRVIVRGRDREGEFSKDNPQTMCLMRRLVSERKIECHDLSRKLAPASAALDFHG